MSKRFFYVRVSLLTLALIGVLAYAARDHARRSARREWQRPLYVALVLLENGEVDPQALALFQARVDRLEEALEAEFVRHGGSFRPIRFQQFGPARETTPPPTPAAEESLWQSLRLSLALGSFARAGDRAARLERDVFDGKIYVRLSAPRSQRRAFVEGLGEEGGRIAVTSLELSEDSADFGLFVVAHELLHLLGANDRYAPDGNAELPDGLGEPDLEPRYPQHTVEVMARGRVLEPGREEPPSQLGELRVGSRTAAEIGWLDAASSPASSETLSPSPRSR